MKDFTIKKFVFVTGFFIFLSISAGCGAVSLNEAVIFNIDEGYDSVARSQLSAVLVKTTSQNYFYIEKGWWDSQVPAKQSEILGNLGVLSQEFESKIYPTLTSTFGSEWKPGVDGDNKISILFHSMRDDFGGYFRTVDEYIKLQAPTSNEREILYLATNKIDDLYQLKVLLAHEFTHLITFNQKNKAFDLEDDTWLNEARADYSTTVLGYNDNYSSSILRERVRDFLENSTDSLTEWKDTKYDYAVNSLFTNYLVDHYGINVLADSLKSKSVGIASINEALKKSGFQDDFSQIFSNWTIAVFVNDCLLGEKYCYLNQNLKNIHLVPSLNFLPIGGSSFLSVTNLTKNWTGNWQKIFGGNGTLKIDFGSLRGLSFQVPYIIQDKLGKISVNFLSLDKDQKGQITVNDFGKQNISVILMPFLQSKTTNFTDNEPTYPYTFTASISNQASNGGAIYPLIPVGFKFNENFSFGTSKQDVVYLKIILAAEGCVSGLANTSYFGTETLKGVKCFQNKYKIAISATAGYQIASTGYVGLGTRFQLNSFLTK